MQQLRVADAGQADATDEPVGARGDHHVELRVEILIGLRTVHHTQIDRREPFDAQRAQVRLEVGAQTGRCLDRQPGPRVVAAATHLADQCQVVGVRVQRLANEFVGHVRPVELGGVDVVDTEFHRPPQHRNGFVVVTGRTEDTGPGQLHRTESHPVDVERAKRKAIRGHKSIRGHESCNPCRVRIHP